MIQAKGSELQKRVLTGVIGGAALICLIIWGGTLGAFLIVAVMALGMVYEFTEMAFALPDRVEKRYALLFLTWCNALAQLILPHSDAWAIIFSLLLLFGFYLFTAKNHSESAFSSHLRELAYSFLGLIYLGVIPGYLLKIYHSAHGVHWTLLFFLVVWSGDSVAYFVGKKFGKKKLYPQISPKKTVEGALGGLLAGVIAAILFKVLFFKGVSVFSVIFVALGVGAVSQIGDLCESFVKRSFHLKDSGSILPGHGGLLDRFDGVVFSLPVMYACISIV